MRRIHILASLYCLAMLIGCKKTTEPINRSTGGSTFPIYTNPPLISADSCGTGDIYMNAGSDILVELPENETELKSSWHSSGRVCGEVRIAWSKISGPDFYEIHQIDSARTKLKHLVKGVYEFQLQGFNQNRTVVSDTVKVIVDQLPDPVNEIILKDLTWIFPWYNTLIVSNFYELSPSLKPGTFFKIFIQRHGSNEWIRVKNNWDDINAEYIYHYHKDDISFYNKGSLYIFYFGNDVSDKPAIKILF